MGDWFYVDASGGQAGPVATPALQQMQKAGQVTPDSLAWRDGMAAWTPIADIPELKPPAARPAPPGGGHPAPPPMQARGPAPPAAQPHAGNGRGPAPGSRAAAEAQKNGGWKARRTVDGGDYYHNVLTDEVRWEKPVELQSAEERQTDSSDCVWLPSERDGGWVPAYVIQRSGNTVTVRPVDGGQNIDVPTTGKGAQKLQPLKLSHLEKRSMQEDVVLLESIDPALIAFCLKHRYQHDDIYTWVGADHSVLVSVNPFKRLNIYGERELTEFSKPSPNKLQPPHTYAIANAAYRAMCAEKGNQSILISGESGAGKTECTKQCLSFLAEVAGSSSGVEQRILQANPVLEAFGNAKTLRNNNSSRFGRWMEVHFYSHGLEEGSIAGAFVENYLLEKSRVVAQMQQGERNYHIFYQLCVSNWGPALSLALPEQFRFTGSTGCTTVEGVNDAEDLDEVLQALAAMAFTQETIQWMFSLCATVMHLGNIVGGFQPVDQGEGSQVGPQAQEALGLAAHYLQVDAGRLGAALVERQVVIRGEVQHMRNKVKDANEAVEALSKAVYSHLFDDLVQRINGAVGGDRGMSIGVLDIFGFEIFETNSFEQLCINFTNERLQQKFNSHTFTQEESLYQAEGVPFDKIPFLDNGPVLELLSSKPYGLMNLLDEEVRVPQGGDVKWVSKCAERHASNKIYGGPGLTQVQHAFQLKHYAGYVVYDCRGMVEKNADRLSRNLYELLAKAGDANTRKIFPPKDEKTAGAKASTVGEKFRSQLTKLMAAIDDTAPFFIRCIKPNHTKKPNQLQMRMVIEQLTYAGVFEAVKIRKGGYPFRLPHAVFAHKYRWIARKEHGWVPISVSPSASPEQYCHAVLSAVHQDFSRVQIGRTLVLYRADEHRVLELLKNLALGRVFQHMQANNATPSVSTTAVGSQPPPHV